MKYILTILIITTAVFAQEVDTLGIPHPEVESVDTNKVIIIYYADAQINGHNILAYDMAYAVVTKFNTPYLSLPTIVYYNRRWEQVNTAFIYDIKQVNWE